jgi:hypothetical protein
MKRKVRRGRPRKGGARKPSGDLKLKAPSPKDIAAKMPHRRKLGDAAVSHLAENELGRQALKGVITPDQLLAGQMFAARAHAYLATIEAPAPPPALIRHGSYTRGGECTNCTDPGDAFCLCSLRKRAYVEMLCQLSRNEFAALYLVAILDMEPENETCLKLFTKALENLVHFFHLTTVRKKEYVGNALSHVLSHSRAVH